MSDWPIHPGVKKSSWEIIDAPAPVAIESMVPKWNRQSANAWGPVAPLLVDALVELLVDELLVLLLDALVELLVDALLVLPLDALVELLVDALLVLLVDELLPLDVLAAPPPEPEEVAALDVPDVPDVPAVPAVPPEPPELAAPCEPASPPHPPTPAAAAVTRTARRAHSRGRERKVISCLHPPSYARQGRRPRELAQAACSWGLAAMLSLQWKWWQVRLPPRRPAAAPTWRGSPS